MIGNARTLLIFIFNALPSIIYATAVLVLHVVFLDALRRRTLSPTAYRRASDVRALEYDGRVVEDRISLVIFHESPKTPDLEINFTKYDSPCLTIA
jgi:hypothetical protein